jgi:hypothetical protein
MIFFIFYKKKTWMTYTERNPHSHIRSPEIKRPGPENKQQEASTQSRHRPGVVGRRGTGFDARLCLSALNWLDDSE